MHVSESTSEEKNLLDYKLVAFNKSMVPFEQSDAWISLSHVLKDPAGQMVAGINASLYCWKIMYVDILYVEDEHRGKGYGKLLLAKAEAKARSLGGYLSHWTHSTGKQRIFTKDAATPCLVCWRIARPVTVGTTCKSVFSAIQNVLIHELRVCIQPSNTAVTKTRYSVC
jgi:GNAT superfamily N-acetyltransferase